MSHISDPEGAPVTVCCDHVGKPRAACTRHPVRFVGRKQCRHVSHKRLVIALAGSLIPACQRMARDHAMRRRAQVERFATRGEVTGRWQFGPPTPGGPILCCSRSWRQAPLGYGQSPFLTRRWHRAPDGMASVTWPASASVEDQMAVEYRLACQSSFKRGRDHCTETM